MSCFLLYSKSPVLYIKNTALHEHIITAAFTFLYVQRDGSTYIAVTHTQCIQADLLDRLCDMKADSDRPLYTAALSFAFTVMNPVFSFPLPLSIFCSFSLGLSPTGGCTSSRIFSDRGQRGNINWRGIASFLRRSP